MRYLLNSTVSEDYIAIPGLIHSKLSHASLRRCWRKEDTVLPRLQTYVSPADMQASTREDHFGAKIAPLASAHRVHTLMKSLQRNRSVHIDSELDSHPASEDQAVHLLFAGE